MRRARRQACWPLAPCSGSTHCQRSSRAINLTASCAWRTHAAQPRCSPALRAGPQRAAVLPSASRLPVLAPSEPLEAGDKYMGGKRRLSFAWCGRAESAQVSGRRVLRREMTPGALSSMLAVRTPARAGGDGPCAESKGATSGAKGRQPVVEMQVMLPAPAVLCQHRLTPRHGAWAESIASPGHLHFSIKSGSLETGGAAADVGCSLSPYFAAASHT